MISHDWCRWNRFVHGRRHRISIDDEEMSIRESIVTKPIIPGNDFTGKMFQDVATQAYLGKRQQENGGSQRSS
jgi:hypothetical protein